jgi:hypothetical protein
LFPLFLLRLFTFFLREEILLHKCEGRSRKKWAGTHMILISINYSLMRFMGHIFMQMITLLFLLKASVCDSEPLTFTQTAILPQGFPIGKVTTLKYCIAGLQEYQCQINLAFQ